MNTSKPSREACVFQPLEPRLLLSGTWPAPGALDLEAFPSLTAEDIPDQRILLDYLFSPEDFTVFRSGSVTSAGDGILHAADLRSLLGVDGTGVKVGLISDGVDSWEDSRTAGDLPQSITIHPNRAGEGDQGTAMLEIIYDLAPGAELFFSSGIGPAANMVGSIEWLVAQGCDVIVDGVGLYLEPMFEDGQVALAAADAVGDGVVYVSAAGDDAQRHHQATYAPDEYGYHQFESGDNMLVIETSYGAPVMPVLQWSDPFGDSDNDYGLDLYAWTGSQWSYILSIDAVQDGDDDPLEDGLFSNTYAPYLGWAIYANAGAETRELEFFVLGSLEGIELSDITPGDSVFGHPAVEAVIAVGAIDAADFDNDDIEPSSSNGPSTIYTSFVSQTSVQRQSLDVAGIDGVHTFVGQEGPFYDPFFGTSAAAPHVAAIAALLLEINPSLTPAQVQDLINGNAVDIEAPGYDPVSGYGRADALATISAAPGTPDLKAVSDTGKYSDDEVTKLDNSETGKELQFDVSGTVDGATVTLYADGELIGTGTGNGGTITITTNGSYDLADGDRDITATQTEPNKLESAESDGLTVHIDTQDPIVTVDELATADQTPALTGTINDNEAEVVVTVDGNEYEEDVTVGSGVWSLADNKIDPALDRGYAYDVSVTATDVAGNAGSDSSMDELIVMIPGDANEDCMVDGADYTVWSDNYGKTDADPWSQGGWTVGNFTEDSNVDGGDYSIWADNYGWGVGGAEALAAAGYDAGDASAGAPAGVVALAALPGGRSPAGPVPSLSGWAEAVAGRVTQLPAELTGAALPPGANQEAEQLPEGSGGRKASELSLYARLGRKLPGLEAELNLLEEPDLTVLPSAI